MELLKNFVGEILDKLFIKKSIRYITILSIPFHFSLILCHLSFYYSLFFLKYIHCLCGYPGWLDLSIYSTFYTFIYKNESFVRTLGFFSKRTSRTFEIFVKKNNNILKLYECEMKDDFPEINNICKKVIFHKFKNVWSFL